VPPGTILKILKPTLETQSGLEAESEFYFAYAPERIAPGKALKEFVENSRLIGGIGTDSTKITAELFKTVCKNVNETDVATAEVAKLAENTFRDVNIAYANQLAIICEQLGVDVMKVIGLANTHPRVNIHMPGPGVGGPCLPKDPYFLLDSLAETNLDLITMARLVNENMPKHLLKLVAEALRIVGKHIKDSRIAVLGVAYKGDVDDSRFSPSEPLVSELLRQGAVVVVYDPICNETFGGEKANSLDEAVKNVDCIVLMTDHLVFRKLDLHEIRASVNDNPVIVDGRRILADCEATNNGFFYYGVGLGKKTTKQKSHGGQPFLHFTAINRGITPQEKASL
jgi:UDP-N-acetyl-D-mannosaminuronic acid dehydrogenase